MATCGAPRLASIPEDQVLLTSEHVATGHERPSLPTRSTTPDLYPAAPNHRQRPTPPMTRPPQQSTNDDTKNIPMHSVQLGSQHGHHLKPLSLIHI
eukprot:10924881-Alexandrium_andersonii.AAC.1